MSLFTRRRSAPAVSTLPATNPTLDSDTLPPSLDGEEAADARPELDLPTFAELGVAPDLIEVLAAQGIDEPFPVQVMTIPDALAGRDVCGKAKAGSGKTLAFGLPLVEHTKTAQRRRPRSLVLVPTRELANQVAEALVPLAQKRGLWLMAVYGGVSINRQIAGLRQGVDLVIATPGRLNDLLERGDIMLDDVETVVIDEADQMADMGFLPQVERILRLVDKDAQTLLFSATLDGDVGQLVKRYQHDPVHHEVPSDSATVETLEQRFVGVSSDAKVKVAARILAGASRAIVFVRTTHGADRLVRLLEREGLTAEAIHGRRSQSQRERTLAAFSKGKCPILVATNVAARGLHIDRVDLVLHYDPPEDAKVYLHRSGRTARAGEGGLVVTLVLAEQERDVTAIERAAGIDYTIVPMHATDERLGDLGAWEPDRGLPADRGFGGGGGGNSRGSGSRGGRGGGPRGAGSRQSRRPQGASGGRGNRDGGGRDGGRGDGGRSDDSRGGAPRRRSNRRSAPRA